MEPTLPLEPVYDPYSCCCGACIVLVKVLVASLTKQFNAAFKVHTVTAHGNSTEIQQQADMEVRIGNGCQTDVGTALWLGVVPKALLTSVVEALVKDIQAHDYHITSGILGTRSVYEALAMNGRMDVALKMLVRLVIVLSGSFTIFTARPYLTVLEERSCD